MKRLFSFNFTFFFVAGGVLLTAPGVTIAEEHASERVFEEVVVTATKREESIQDVPIAISAFTDEDLDARGIQDVFTLQQVAPSLFINTSNSTTNGGTIRIRGIGTTGNNVGLEAAVGAFVDGVYRSRSGQALNDIIDVERIEVLRGPQGTLFGKNTSAGAVHIITKSPEYEPGGSVSVTAGSRGTIRTEGYYTGGLSDTIAFRVAGKYQQRDGYYKDIDTGDEYSEIDRYTFKGQLLFEPSDKFEGRVILDYTERDESCCPATYSYLDRGVTAAVRAVGGTAVVSADGDVGVNYPPYEDVKDFGITFHANWDLGFGDLESVLSTRNFEVERGQDSDFSKADIYQLSDTDEEFDSTSLEVRLVGTKDNFDWLVGFIYGVEDISSAGRFLELASRGQQYFTLILPGLYAPAVTAGSLTQAQVDGIVLASRTALMEGMGLRGSYSQDADFWALFTHNTWHVNDKLALTLGLRLSQEDKDGSTIINGTGVADTVGTNWPCATVRVTTFCGNAGYSLSRSDDEPTGTLKASYAFTDSISAYASLSRGYKSGGFNLDPTAYKLGANNMVTTDSREFKPEIADTIEIGMKAQLLDGALTLNLAVWDGGIDDFQLNTFEGAFFTVNNVPDVDARGMEVEYNWWIGDYIRLSGGVTNINTRYGSSAGTAVGKPGIDGRRLTNAPEWQASTALFVDAPLTDTWNYRVNVNWFHRGRHNTGSDLDARKWQGAHNLVNAQVGFVRSDDKYEITAWVSNAADTKYKTLVFNSVSQGDNRSTFVGEPRVYGLTLTANFQ